VTLVRTNGAFVESVLLGINHALARELSWRRFPLDSPAVMVERFWSGTEGTDPPMPSPVTWNAADPLGTHGSAADDLVLLLRGELLRRHPEATLHLTRTAADGTERRLEPVLAGTIGNDVVFRGFRLTPAEALAGAVEPGSSGWSVVVAEPEQRARFGLDEPADPEVPALAAPPMSWQDLDWSHPHLAAHNHVPVTGPLAGIRRPLSRGGSATAVWGADAANIAVATQQPAFRLRIPIALWLRPLLEA
jgi:hypothetical protein